MGGGGGQHAAPPNPSLYSPDCQNITHHTSSQHITIHHHNQPHITSPSSSSSNNDQRGRLLVVDIQGVGDLFTDPQIHTPDGRHFGDGNLGLRGFALFFRTHACNALCKSLGLPEFARCAADVKLSARQGAGGAGAELPGGIGGGVGGGGGAGATLRASFVRHRSLVQDLRRQLSRARRRGAAPLPEAQLLRELERAPLAPSVTALVHHEVARVHAEACLLPELRPGEDPDDARAGGVFHLQAAAALGCALSQCVLARAHLGLDASGPQFAHLLREAAARGGELRRSPALALRYTALAAERGVRAAAAALAHAYATGAGVGEGVLERPAPALAARWLRVALGDESPPGALRPADEDDWDAPLPAAPQAAAAAAAGSGRGVVVGGGGAETTAPSPARSAPSCVMLPPPSSAADSQSAAASSGVGIGVGRSGQRAQGQQQGQQQLARHASYMSWGGEVSDDDGASGSGSGSGGSGGSGGGSEEDDADAGGGGDSGSGGEDNDADADRDARRAAAVASVQDVFGAFACLAEAEAEVRWCWCLCLVFYPCTCVVPFP